jgi:hypothetical protein
LKVTGVIPTTLQIVGRGTGSCRNPAAATEGRLVRETEKISGRRRTERESERENCYRMVQKLVHLLNVCINIVYAAVFRYVTTCCLVDSYR